MPRLYYERHGGLLGYYAGFASRAAALIIDTAIISLIISTVALIISSLPGLIRYSVFVPIEYFDFSIELGPTQRIFWLALASVSGILFAIIYHVFFVATAGRTPGKAFMGLRVLTTDGQRVPIWRAIVRIVGIIVAALPLFVGLLWVLLDDRRQGLHDKLAGTCVIYTWAARPDERFLAEQIQHFARRSTHHKPPEADRS